MKVHIAKEIAITWSSFQVVLSESPSLKLLRDFWKMQFKEALVIEFCMMFHSSSLCQNQLDFVNSKKKKRYWLWTPLLDLSLISLWVLTNSKIAVNCFHLFIGEGNLWGETWSNIQPLDLWFWAYSHCFAIRSWPRCMCQTVL